MDFITFADCNNDEATTCDVFREDPQIISAEAFTSLRYFWPSVSQMKGTRSGVGSVEGWAVGGWVGREVPASFYPLSDAESGPVVPPSEIDDARSNNRTYLMRLLYDGVR